MGFYDSLGSSRFLRKEDAGAPNSPGLLLTITEGTRENVAKDNEEPKFKLVLWFSETDKGFAVGPFTGRQIGSFLGEPEQNDKCATIWYGHKIVLFHDPNVMMGNKLVGGIRVRQPRNQPVQGQSGQVQQPPQRQAVPAPQPASRPAPPPEDDDVPW